MFRHIVLFKIAARHVPTYRTDCRMWAKEARKHPGFIRYETLVRTNEKGQYASCYTWRSEADHRRFMKAHHDRLVSLSHCPVEVVGYFNYKNDRS